MENNTTLLAHLTRYPRVSKVLPYLHDAGMSGAMQNEAGEHLCSDVCQFLRMATSHSDPDYAFVLATMPNASTTQPGRLAYYATERKMLDNLRTPIKVRKYLEKLPTLAKDKAWLEDVAKHLDDKMRPLSDLDVRIFDSSQLDGWREAYYTNNNVRSCMSSESEYGVAEYETYRCYCTAHYGLPDNGLKLAALYHEGQYVARCIVFTNEDGENCYIKSYGDSRLEKWLSDRGYQEVNGFPDGTTLVALEHNGGHIHPYVDGDNYNADLHYSADAGHHYWVIDGGSHRLDYANGLIGGDDYRHCDHCGDDYPEDEGYYREDLDGNSYDICECCDNNHCWWVHNGDSEAEYYYVPDIYGRLGDTIWCYQGEYYTQEGLDYADLVAIGGEVYSKDSVYYCDDDEEWHTGEADDDVVCVDDAPSECGWDERWNFVTRDHYERYGHRLPYREDGQDTTDPQGNPWLYCDDRVLTAGVTKKPVHLDDVEDEVNYFTRPNGRQVRVWMLTQEAVETYPELAQLEKVTYEWLYEMNYW